MTSDAPAVVPRDGARILLLDSADRLLLFRGRDPGDRLRGTWWFTPGGGVDAGENHRHAAQRELAEETGLRIEQGDLLGPVWHWTSEFDFCGTRYRQLDQFFLTRVRSWDVDTSGFSALELASVDEPRWWDLGDLAVTTETVYPPGLCDQVRTVAAENPAGPGAGE